MTRRAALAVCVAVGIVLLAAGCGGSKKKEGGIEAGKTYDAVVETNHGTFTIRLDTEHSPKTTGSFVKLAEKGFFDGTIFHRIVPGFVIQGGDPTGTGTGGPGYKTVEAPPANTQYTHGLVAMAKAGNEAAGTAGSQFFVVTGANIRLPPDYAVLGRVQDGLDVVDAIGKLGNASEQPTERVEIKQLTIKTS